MLGCTIPPGSLVCRDPLAQGDDVMVEAVLVPALRFCGQPARWTGSPSSHKVRVLKTARTRPLRRGGAAAPLSADAVCVWGEGGTVASVLQNCVQAQIPHRDGLYTIFLKIKN